MILYVLKKKPGARCGAASGFLKEKPKPPVMRMCDTPPAAWAARALLASPPAPDSPRSRSASELTRQALPFRGGGLEAVASSVCYAQPPSGSTATVRLTLAVHLH